MRKVGLLFNSKIAAAADLALRLEEVLSGLNTSVWICPASNEAKAKDEIAETEFLLSLGGDGTILRAARLAAPFSVPILGINLGDLGFAAEIQGEEALDKVPRFLSGGERNIWIDERAMLQVELPQDAPLSPSSLHALNDVVVGRGKVIRIVRLKASIDGQLLTTYKGDGVILATATGSTGYSLAAGGPILYPQAKEILLTPIAPHLSLATPLVLSSESMVELEIQTNHEARISIDGQVEFPLHNEDIVKVRRSPYAARFLRAQSSSFFYQELQKLKLG